MQEWGTEGSQEMEEEAGALLFIALSPCLCGTPSTLRVTWTFS